jgi:hypothetical protein
MKNRDIVIIAGVAVAAYYLLRQKQPARGYNITVPAPDVLSRQEYERQIAAQRRSDALKNVATTAGNFLQKLFSRDRKPATVETRQNLSAGMSPVIGPKKIGIIY